MLPFRRPEVSGLKSLIRSVPGVVAVVLLGGALLAVGLWAAQLGGRALWLLPAGYRSWPLGSGLARGA